MAGISGIQSVQNYMGMQQIQLPDLGAAGSAAAGSGQLAAGGLAGLDSGNSILAMSSTSIQSSMQSIIASGSPMLSTNEALGAALLLLILQYMQSSDQSEKKDLLSTIMSLAGSQQQAGAAGAGGGSSLMYTSSSLSIESTQLLIVGPSAAFDAYAGAAASLQQTPQVDPSASQIDVSA